ncbi:MAG: lysine--tRNA ligase [Minisyncoccota bacterium]
MASLEELRNERIKKLQLLRAAGMDAYPIVTPAHISIADAVARFDALCVKERQEGLVGRVVAIREQGSLIFFNFSDGTGTFQGLYKRDSDEEMGLFNLFVRTVDLGDFIWVKGSFFTTKTGAKTVQVNEWTMLAKALRPLPDKWAGLQDTEERFRKRYLDTLMSEEARQRFMIRSQVVSEIRRFLDTAGYIEVETPVLQAQAGGATAEPFMTYHNALDMDMYLRIAPELYLKRLLVGGFSKVYEFARNFRNEGIDATHNPEFTMLEFYESFSDAAKQRRVVENLFNHIASTVFKEVTVDGVAIDFQNVFNVVTFYDLLRKYAQIADPKSASIEELTSKAAQCGVEVEKNMPREKLLDAIYKKMCRPKLIQPTFIIEYPVDYLPLAKRMTHDLSLVDAFQLVAGGIELVKAFSELNDPLDQAERFRVQDENRKQGDKEAQTSDMEFLEALEHGMPPAGGVGIGIDRLIMFFTDTKNIREVILFPTLRPKG